LSIRVKTKSNKKRKETLSFGNLDIRLPIRVKTKSNTNTVFLAIVLPQ